MAFYHCTICEDNGSPIAENVMVSLEMTTRGDVTEWYGTVTVGLRANLAAGQRYRIVLADGRTGEFMVRRNTYAGGEDRAVAIRGSGPLK